MQTKINRDASPVPLRTVFPSPPFLGSPLKGRHVLEALSVPRQEHDLACVAASPISAIRNLVRQDESEPPNLVMLLTLWTGRTERVNHS